MQKKHAKELFIDSSCRRASLLKTLLTGHHHAEDVDLEDESGERNDQALSFPDARGTGAKDDQAHMKIAASL